MGFFNVLSKIGKSAFNSVLEEGENVQREKLAQSWDNIRDKPNRELSGLLKTKRLQDTKQELVQLVIIRLYRVDRSAISGFISSLQIDGAEKIVKRNILEFCNSNIIRNSDTYKLDDLKACTQMIINEDFDYHR